MTLENKIVVFHQEGNIVFGLREGGYCIEDGKLAASVQAERLDDGEFPACADFCIFDFPILDNLNVGDSFNYKRSGYDLYEFEGQPKAHAYFQFHVSDLETTWTIIGINNDEILFSIEAIHDDIDYYDGRAKPTPTRGLFRLRPRPMSELWIP